MPSIVVTDARIVAVDLRTEQFTTAAPTYACPATAWSTSTAGRNH
jgi:hypothetical protein